MTQTAAQTTISASRITVGAPVYVEDAQAAHEQCNWTFQNVPTVHVSMACGADSWGATGNEAMILGIYAPVSATHAERLRCYVKIDADITTIILGASVQCAASNTVEVKWTFSGGAYTTTHTAAQNGAEVTTTAPTSAIGTGWRLCIISLARTAGGAATNNLRQIRIEDQAPNTLADPVSEPEACRVVVGADDVTVGGDQVVATGEC